MEVNLKSAPTDEMSRNDRVGVHTREHQDGDAKAGVGNSSAGYEHKTHNMTMTGL